MNDAMTERDAAIIAVASRLDELIAKGHTGTLVVEVNLLNGAVLEASGQHKDRLYKREKRKS